MTYSPRPARSISFLPAIWATACDRRALLLRDLGVLGLALGVDLLDQPRHVGGRAAVDHAEIAVDPLAHEPGGLGVIERSGERGAEAQPNCEQSDRAKA